MARTRSPVDGPRGHRGSCPSAAQCQVSTLRPAVGPVRQTHDLAGRGQVGHLRPRQPLEVDEQPMLARRGRTARRSLGPLFDCPAPSHDVGRVERAGADDVGHAEQLVVAEAKIPTGSSSGGMMTSVAPGVHHHAGSISATARPWSSSIVTQVGVSVARLESPTRSRGPTATSPRTRRRGPLPAARGRRVARQRARAQHEVTGSEGHSSTSVAGRDVDDAVERLVAAVAARGCRRTWSTVTLALTGELQLMCGLSRTAG